MKSSHSRARIRKPTWISQPSTPGGGCGIACVAMLTDRTYNDVRDIAPWFCEKCGVETEPIDHLLSSLGYSVRRLHQFREFDGKPEALWPPQPFAPIHLALVMQTAKDYEAHYVVVDGHGNVSDPADVKPELCGLSRYHDVLWVAGVYRVA